MTVSGDAHIGRMIPNGSERGILGHFALAKVSNISNGYRLESRRYLAQLNNLLDTHTWSHAFESKESAALGWLTENPLVGCSIPPRAIFAGLLPALLRRTRMGRSSSRTAEFRCRDLTDY